MVIEFWFEFASAYAYPAAWRIERTAAAQGVRVVWRPFLLGPLLRRQQGLADSPFNLTPAKGRYMWRDMERICRKEMLPFRRPKVFPTRSLAAARLALVGARRGWIAPFSRSVYEAYFGDDQDISNLEVLKGLVRAAGGDPVRDLLDAESDEIKTELRSNGAEAERKGLFGSPSFYCYPAVGGAGELFWGNDRLEEAVAWASGRDHHLSGI
jgi:2-hydroxychromene-2-carboxylate isomerase